MKKTLLTVIVVVGLLIGVVRAEDVTIGDWLYKNPSVFSDIGRGCDVFGFPKYTKEDEKNGFGVFAGPYGERIVLLSAAIFKKHPLFELLSPTGDRQLIETADSVITGDIFKTETMKNIRFLIGYEKLIVKTTLKSI